MLLNKAYVGLIAEMFGFTRNQNRLMHLSTCIFTIWAIEYNKP